MKKLLLIFTLTSSFSAFACFSPKVTSSIIKKASYKDCTEADLTWAKTTIAEDITAYSDKVDTDDGLNYLLGVGSIGALKGSLALIEIELNSRKH